MLNSVFARILLAFSLTTSFGVAQGATAASVLTFDALALFADPSLEDLSPFVFSPAAVVDEATLGTLVGFQVPGDVAPGTLASSGSQGLLNLFDPTLRIALQQPTAGLTLHLVSLRGDPLMVEGLDALDAVVELWQGLPTTGPSGFPQTVVSLTKPGITTLRISAGPEATSFFLDDLTIVPEPRLGFLLALGVLGASFRRARTHSRLAVVVTSAALLFSCSGQPVSIVSPLEGSVVFGPSTSARIAFSPPVQGGETLEVTLVRGIDDPDQAPQLLDVSAGLVLAADGTTASIDVTALAPGRNTLSVKRFPAGGGAASGFDTVTVDRGGFFPNTTGPWNAGVRTDQAMFTGALGTPRVLDLNIWYPTDAMGAPVPLLGGILDAPVAPGVSELPVLFFSHGSCAIPAESTFLTAGLARAGWLVVAMTHPPNVFSPVCATPANLAASFAERPTDVSSSLDWLVAANADPASPFFGLADLNRVGVAGHSFGGMTAVRVPASDPRFIAALPMAPEYDSVAILIDNQLPLDVPIMIQGGELDLNTPFLLDQVPLYNKSIATRFLVEFLGADHGSFSDFCLAPAVCDPGLINHYAFGFLGRYVAGDRRWESLIQPVAGAVLTSDP